MKEPEYYTVATAETYNLLQVGATCNYEDMDYQLAQYLMHYKQQIDEYIAFKQKQKTRR